MMGNTVVALSFVLFMNLLMFLGQASVIELNLNEQNNTFYNYEGNIMYEFDSNKNQSNPILNQSYYNEMPGSGSGIEISEGNIFTDTFISIKNWIARKTGLVYLKQIVSAPYNLLSSMHLPQTLTYAIGTVWYAITIFLIVSFIWGRE